MKIIQRTPKSRFKKIVSFVMIYQTSMNIFPYTKKKRVPRKRESHLHFSSAQEVAHRLIPTPDLGIVNKAPLWIRSKDRPPPIILCLRWTSALLLVFDQKDCVLPSTGGHQYYAVLQLLACHLYRAPLVILLSCAELQVGAHAPGIHRSWNKQSKRVFSKNPLGSLQTVKHSLLRYDD